MTTYSSTSKQPCSALRASKTRKRRFFETALYGIIILDAATGRVDDVNPCLVDMLGYTHEELLGKKLWDMGIFKNERIGKEILKQLCGKGHIHYDDLPLVTKCGRAITVEFTNNVFYMVDNKKIIQCNIRDITEQKQVAKKLKLASTYNRCLIETSLDPFVTICPDGRITDVNTATEQVTGHSREELIGTDFSDYFTNPEKARAGYRQGFKEGMVRDYELEIKHRDGYTTPVIYNASIYRDKTGQIMGIFATARDITNRRRAEELLKKSEEKYRTLFEESFDGLFITSSKGKILDMNKKGVMMFGYDTKEEILNLDLEKYVYAYPPDRARILSLVNTQGTAEYEVIVKKKTGEEMVTHCSLTAVRDKKGLITSYRGVIRDITERKQAEQALKESEAKYRSIFEKAIEGMYQTIPDGRFLSINPAMAHMHGYESPEEMMTNVTNIGKQLYVNPEDRMRYRNLLQTHEIVERFETQTYRKDGTQIWVSLNAHVVKDDAGKILYFEGTAEDIAERKLAEEELKQTLEKLRKSLISTIQVMSLTIETKDPYTAGHQRRVSNLARTIAQEMGLAKDTIDNIRMAGIIHDIGKMSVPAEILSKPGKLNDIEMSLIKFHSQLGYDILKDAELPYPIAKIVLQHHERLDGSGYPEGLKGDQILLEAHILAVADVVEATASHRPYRPALGIDVALEEIEKNKGILYDTEVVEACLKLFREKGFIFESKE
jgi:PAS domain S-box-containing protein/putative nucleotidyltransferase with HDIG domain